MEPQVYKYHRNHKYHGATTNLKPRSQRSEKIEAEKQITENWKYLHIVAVVTIAMNGH